MKRPNVSKNVYLIRPGTFDEKVFGDTRGYNNRITLNPNDVWLDIGAHIGSFCVSIAESVKQIYAYEPQSENFEMLEFNVSINNCKNIICEKKGIVGNDDEIRRLYLGNTGAHSMFTTTKEDYEEVICKNINEICEIYEPNKIKMDAEGVEYEIVQSFNYEKYKLDELIFEFHFNALKDRRLEKIRETIKTLKKNFVYVEHKPLEKLTRHWHTNIYASNNQFLEKI